MNAVDKDALVEQFDLSALTPDFFRDPYPWYHAAIRRLGRAYTSAPA